MGVPALPRPPKTAKGLLRSGLPDELAARRDLAVHAGRQRLRVLLGRGPDDEELRLADHRVALPLELLCQRRRLVLRGALDAHLPRRVAAVELLLLPRLRRRLVVPALLVGEPVLDLARLRLDAVLAQLRLDHDLRLRRVIRRGGVDEDDVVLAGDREPLRLEVLGELGRLAADADAEPLHQPAGMLLVFDEDPDAPVVSHAGRA